MRKKKKYAPKCYCIATLLPDGTCRHGCDPALRRPGTRRLAVASKAKKRENAHARQATFLGLKDAREGAARVGLREVPWKTTNRAVFV